MRGYNFCMTPAKSPLLSRLQQPGCYPHTTVDYPLQTSRNQRSGLDYVRQKRNAGARLAGC